MWKIRTQNTQKKTQRLQDTMFNIFLRREQESIFATLRLSVKKNLLFQCNLCSCYQNRI